MPKSRLASDINTFASAKLADLVKNIGVLILMMLTYDMNALIVPSVTVRLRIKRSMTNTRPIYQIC